MVCDLKQNSHWEQNWCPKRLICWCLLSEKLIQKLFQLTVGYILNRLPETQFQLTKLPLSKLLNAVRYHFITWCYSSDHKVVEFQIPREVRKESNKVETLDFRIADFSLFKKLVGWIPWETALKGKGAHESWQVCPDSPSQCLGKQADVAGDWLG